MKNSDIEMQNGSAARGPGRRGGWLSAALVALAFTTAASAAPSFKAIEECLESGSREVSLPGVAGGTLAASPCAGCPTMRLRFDGKTRYFIGKEQVSYTKLREAAAKGDLRLDLFYEPKSLTLSRLRLAAAGGVQ
jgi:hypothetical protein